MTQPSKLRNLARKAVTFGCMFMFCVAGYSQVKLTKAFLEGSTWTSNNNSKSFYVSNTIKLLKIPNETINDNGCTLDLADYFKSDFVTISFYKKKKLVISSTDIELWTVSTKQGKYKWTFDENAQKLKLLFNSKLVGLFKPIAESKVKVKSAYAGVASLETKEVKMLRVFQR
jgi:hypothetical protein